MDLHLCSAYSFSWPDEVWLFAAIHGIFLEKLLLSCFKVITAVDLLCWSSFKLDWCCNYIPGFCGVSCYIPIDIAPADLIKGFIFLMGEQMKGLIGLPVERQMERIFGCLAEMRNGLPSFVKYIWQLFVVYSFCPQRTNINCDFMLLKLLGCVSETPLGDNLDICANTYLTCSCSIFLVLFMAILVFLIMAILSVLRILICYLLADRVACFIIPLYKRCFVWWWSDCFRWVAYERIPSRL